MTWQNHTWIGQWIGTGLRDCEHELEQTRHFFCEACGFGIWVLCAPQSPGLLFYIFTHDTIDWEKPNETWTIEQTLNADKPWNSSGSFFAWDVLSATKYFSLCAVITLQTVTAISGALFCCPKQAISLSNNQNFLGEPNSATIESIH